MPYRSLRAKLLMWYVAALLAVTAAFAALLYADFRRSLYEEVDRSRTGISSSIWQPSKSAILTATVKTRRTTSSGIIPAG